MLNVAKEVCGRKPAFKSSSAETWESSTATQTRLPLFYWVWSWAECVWLTIKTTDIALVSKPPPWTCPIFNSFLVWVCLPQIWYMGEISYLLYKSTRIQLGICWTLWCTGYGVKTPHNCVKQTLLILFANGETEAAVPQSSFKPWPC